MTSARHKPFFTLPPKGTLIKVNPTDPLDSYYVPVVGGLYVRRIEMALELLRGRPQGRVLEIGFGSGIMVPALRGLADEYVGVDLDADPELVMQGLRKLGVGEGVRLLKGDLRTLDLGTFDLVAAISIFEHVAPVGPFIAEVAKLVKPGGRLLVGMPRVDKVMSAMLRAIGYAEIDDFHVTTYAEFREEASPHLRLVEESRMPAFLPEALALYHVALFAKEG